MWAPETCQAGSRDDPELGPTAVASLRLDRSPLRIAGAARIVLAACVESLVQDGPSAPDARAVADEHGAAACVRPPRRDETPPRPAPGRAPRRGTPHVASSSVTCVPP